MSKKPTIGQLFERERRGEDSQLRPSDRELFEVIKRVIAYLLQDEFDQHAWVRDFLLNLIWISPLPTRGRPRKGIALMAQEEKELAKERSYRQRNSITLERAANRLLNRTAPPLFMKNKTLRMSVKTVMHRLKQSPQL